MQSTKMAGILSIILGLFFIICPVISSGTISIMIGLSLISLGIFEIVANFSVLNIIIGILTILCGFLFMFRIDALSFLLGIQFYLIGFLMIILGISGIFAGPQVSKISSILIVILGIISFALGGFSIAQPLYAAILVGVSLILQGIRFVMEP